MNFPYIEDWFKFDPYTNNKEKQNPLETTVTIRRSKNLISAKILYFNTNLKSFHGSSISRSFFNKFHSDHIAHLVLKSGHSISINSVADVAHEITNLWSLLCGIYISPRHIFFRKTRKYKNSYSKYEVSIYIPMGEHAFLDKIHASDFIIDYPAVKKNIGEIFNNWFKDKDNSQAIRDLFFKSFLVNRKKIYRIDQFLNYMAVIEIYGRNYSTNLLNKKDRGVLLEKIRGLITDNVNNHDLRDKLIQSTQNLFYSSLTENIIALSQHLTPETRNSLSILDEKEIKRLVKTRNYYTHYTDHSAEKRIPSKELPEVMDKLCILIIILMLKDLGFEEKFILSRLQKVWIYRQKLNKQNA